MEPETFKTETNDRICSNQCVWSLEPQTEFVFPNLGYEVKNKSSGSPGRKKIRASPYKESMCGALTQVETTLVNLVSRVRSLKLTAATGDQRQCPNIQVLADGWNNITIYEIWDTRAPDEVDFRIKEEE